MTRIAMEHGSLDHYLADALGVDADLRRKLEHRILA